MPAAWPIEPPGIWVELLGARRDIPCPGLFLDRDGVVIEDRGYIRDPAEVTLMPGIGPLIAQARQKGWAVAVVTNQSGIARGLFGWDDFAAVQAEMMRQLAAQDVAVDAVAACPFHPEFTAAYDDEAAQWRKPGPRMIEVLATRLNINLTASWMIGDKSADIAAARRAGLAGGMRVIGGSGSGNRTNALTETPEGFQVRTVDTLAMCSDFLRDVFSGAIDDRIA